MTAYGAVLNGRLDRVENLTLSVTDLGLVRGDGVFEVFQLYDGQPFAMHAHLDRMERSAAAIELDLDRKAIESDIVILLESIEPQDGNVRVIATRNGTRLILQEGSLTPPERYRLALVEHRVSPLMAGVKSLSYALNCHARRVAQSRGYDDALLVDLDSGQILEGPFTAFAWVEDGQIWTPPLSAGILDSITRRKLLEATDAQERRCTRDQLALATEACVLGTGQELVLVDQIEGFQKFGKAPVLSAAREALLALIHTQLPS